MLFRMVTASYHGPTFTSLSGHKAAVLTSLYLTCHRQKYCDDILSLIGEEYLAKSFTGEKYKEYFLVESAET